MPTVQQTDEFQEILNILDPAIGHFADKLAKWIDDRTAKRTGR